MCGERDYQRDFRKRGVIGLGRRAGAGRKHTEQIEEMSVRYVRLLSVTLWFIVESLTLLINHK